MTDTDEPVRTPQKRERPARGHRPSEEPAAPSKRLIVVGLAVGVLVAAVAGWWFWLSPSHKSSYSDEDTRDAKAKVCMQAKLVAQGVAINTNLDDPEPGDVRGLFAVNANARLALLGGGAYLHDLVRDQPAAPSDLTDAVSTAADTMAQLGVNYLANQPDEAQVPVRQALDTQLQKIVELCR